MQGFIIYFIFNLLICLNFYSKNIFESNQNNLNILKSLVSKIIYRNIFYHKQINYLEIEQSINNTNIIKNTSDININNRTKSK
jgi:hypothetical protein